LNWNGSGLTANHGITAKVAGPNATGYVAGINNGTTSRSRITLGAGGALNGNIASDFLTARSTGAPEEVWTAQRDGTNLEAFTSGVLSKTTAATTVIGSTFPASANFFALAYNLVGTGPSSQLTNGNLQFLIYHDTLTDAEVASLHTTMTEYLEGLDAAPPEIAGAFVFPAFDVVGTLQVPVKVTAPSTIYDIAVQKIVTHDFDASNLRVLLVNSTAAFNRDHTHIDQVTNNGAHEVFGSNWPQGGRVLSGVSVDAIGGEQAALDADDTDTLVFMGSSKTFRSLVIYDGTSGAPILFSNSGANRTIEGTSGLKLNFDALGLVLFGAP
jgi:hypothetical protein